VGKSALCVKIAKQFKTTAYFDFSRKIDYEYCKGVDGDCAFTLIPCDTETAFMVSGELTSSKVKDSLCLVFDDLAYMGDNKFGRERKDYLYERFCWLQRRMIDTGVVALVVNQVRIDPMTSRAYNPLSHILDPRVKLKMHVAERLGSSSRIYIDAEKGGVNSARTAVIVSKNGVE